MSGFEMQRLGILMEPAGNTHGVEGVLNPAAARSPDGELYRFPRFVARGITRVSALREYVSIKLAIPPAPTGSASHWSRRFQTDHSKPQNHHSRVEGGLPGDWRLGSLPCPRERNQRFSGQERFPAGTEKIDLQL